MIAGTSRRGETPGARPLILAEGRRTMSLRVLRPGPHRGEGPREVQRLVTERGHGPMPLPMDVRRRRVPFDVYFARRTVAFRSFRARCGDLGASLRAPVPGPCIHRNAGQRDRASFGYAESGVPYEQTVVRNRYVGRTFIEPTQRVRELGVRIKLNPITGVLRGKRVVVVDDSIVRGTTCQRMIAMIRDSGAEQVHMRISSPPVRFPCYYGIDTPSRSELAAARMSIKKLEQEVGADSLPLSRKRTSSRASVSLRTYARPASPAGIWREGKPMGLSYRDSGVDILESDRWTEIIKASPDHAEGPQRVAGIGGSAASTAFRRHGAVGVL